jgi:hypothetical protein
MSRKSFGEMIGLYDTHGGAIGRFMSGAAGTRGKAYPAIIRFFRTYDVQRMIKLTKEKKALVNDREKEEKVLAKKEEKEKKALARRKEKEKKVVAKEEGKEKKAFAKIEEKEKKAFAKIEEKGKKLPANKEKKVSAKRKREEEAAVSPRSITDLSLEDLSNASPEVDKDYLAQS